MGGNECDVLTSGSSYPITGKAKKIILALNSKLMPKNGMEGIILISSVGWPYN
jgi:hypothetical protein